MDGKTAAAQRCNLSNLVELLRSSARLIRNGALADRGATGLVLRRKGEQIVWESHGLDPVKWSRKLSPAERAAFINETGIDLGDQPLPIGPPETSDELHAHLWRAFIFGMRLRSPEVGSPPSAEELETCADTLARFDRPGSESSFGLTAPREAATTPTRAAAGDGVVPPGGSASTAPSYLADVRAFVATADACVVEVERWRQEDGHFVSPGLDRRWRTPFESMHRLYSEKIAPLCQCPLELPKDQGPFDWVREHHADGEIRIMLNQDCGHVVARLATERAEHDSVKLPTARVGDAKALLKRLWAWLAGFDHRDPGGTAGGGDTVPSPPAIDQTAIERAVERAAEKVARALGSNRDATTNTLPVRTEVVLWEGAEHNERNVRLARTRSAYLEAHGNVAAALAALKAGGNKIARRTFYNHLDALDAAIPRWRDSVQVCNEPAQMHGTRIVGTRGKSRGTMR